MKKTKNNKGFSLVELIVVVLILGILAVAVTPQVMKWVGKSKLSTDKDSANALKSAVNTALADWQGDGGKIPMDASAKDCVIQIDKNGTVTVANDWGGNNKGTTYNIKYYVDEVTAKDYPKFQYEKLAAADVNGLTTDATLGTDIGFFIVIHKQSGKVEVKCKAQTVTE